MDLSAELIKNATTSHIIFTILGEYTAAYNFDLALTAFAKYMKTGNPTVRNLSVIAFCGNYNNEDLEQKNYRERMYQSADYREHVARIVLYDDLSWTNKKYLLRKSRLAVLLHSGEQMNRDIIKSMFYGRPVLGLHGGFCKQVIKHGLSGYLVSPDINCISNSFETMADRLNLYNQMMYNTKKHYWENLVHYNISDYRTPDDDKSKGQGPSGLGGLASEAASVPDPDAMSIGSNDD